MFCFKNRKKEVNGIIISCDIVGFSKLSQDRQEEAVNKFRNKLKEISNKNFLGKISGGDGLKAVNYGNSKELMLITALELIDHMKPFEIRTGIHKGEVLIRPDKEMEGTSLTDVSRIMESSGASQISISNQVFKDFFGQVGTKKQINEHEFTCGSPYVYTAKHGSEFIINSLIRHNYKLLRVALPDISGKYNGILTSSYPDNTNSIKLKHTKQIENTLSGMKIISETYKRDGSVSSPSESTTAKIYKENDSFIIKLRYKNDGNNKLDAHDGSEDIQIKPDGILEGTYYTQRITQTKGTIRLERIK